jgi:hypothetical protein
LPFDRFARRAMNTIDPSAVLARFPADPSWHLHQLDWERERALLVQLDRAAVRQAAFLDERVVSPGTPGFWAPLAAVQARAAQAPRAVPHAIFHIGHCGSTLLARQLEQWSGVLSLREPLILRTLSDWQHDLNDVASARLTAPAWTQWFSDCLALLARPHAGDAHVIVKATSSGNGLIAPWLARDGNARAVLLWIPLDEYLATILKSPDARADLRRFAPARQRVLREALGDAAPVLGEQSTATIIAFGWLAEMWRFNTLAAAHPIVLQLVEFGALLRDGAAALADVAAHVGLDRHDRTALDAALAPAVHGRYAKATDHAYDVEARAADLAESRRRFGTEIEAGFAAVEALVVAHPALAPVRAQLRR